MALYFSLGAARSSNSFLKTRRDAFLYRYKTVLKKERSSCGMVGFQFWLIVTENRAEALVHVDKF